MIANASSPSDPFADRFVTLRGGPIVPAPAFLLLLDLERRGCSVERDGRALVIGRVPGSRTDRTAIRRWKWHLLMLLAYCTRTDPHAHLFRDDDPPTTRPEILHVKGDPT